MGYNRCDMSRYARKKGHDFEREISRDFNEIGYDTKTTRNARGGNWSATDNGIDLVNTGRYDVQCKRLASYVSVNTIKEIKGEGIPLLITKANGEPSMAIMPWDELKKLLVS